MSRRNRTAGSAAVANPENVAPSVLSEPPYAGWWAALVYALCALSLAYPALHGGFLLNLHNDQYIGGYAFREFAAQSLRAGHGFPQWNPFFFGGMPYIAAMHGDIFYPTFLLRLVMPTDVAMTWEFVIHLVLAGIFTYWFLRAWGLGFFPALFGGLAYMMAGWVASYASPGHDGKLFVSALTPLALLQITRGVRDGRMWAWGALALTIGLGVLSPHPPMLQYMLLTCGAFTLFCALSAQPNGTRLRRNVVIQRLAFALGAVVLGGLIGAVQYAPVLGYVAWSPRAGGTPYEFATSYSFPIEELINVYLPQFSGILDRYWGRNLIHLHSEYIGVVVLFLAPLAFARGGRRAFARFWLGVAVVTLLWALGGDTPFFRLIYAIVPGTKYFRAPSTIFYVTTFCVSIFAALGLERVLAGRVTARYAYGWLIAAAAMALLASVGMITGLAESLATSSGADMLRLEGYDPAKLPQVLDQIAQRARANNGAVILGAWRSFAFVLAAAIAVLGFLRRRITPPALAWILVAVAAADLWSIDRLYWLFMAPARTLFASDPTIEFLKRQPQPGRVVVYAVNDSTLVPRDPYFGADNLGKESGFMVHGIRTLTGYHSNELGRYQVIGGEVVTGKYSNTLSPQFWRHENARWLYTDKPIGDPSLRLRVGPTKNSAGSRAYLYELPGENPYAWIATAKTMAPDTVSLAAVMDARFDPTRVAVFDTSAHLSSPPLAALPEPSTVHAAVSKYGPGQATIALDAPAPDGATLLVAENYYPGWHATSAGKEMHVARADYNLIGVELPAGARTIELSFAERRYGLGKALTILALGLSFALIAFGVAAQRRPRQLAA